MKEPLKGVFYVVILIALGLLGFQAGTRVSAIVPQTTEIVVSTIGSDSVLNVTVYHSPETLSHYVNLVEVDVDGGVQGFPVNVQPSTTFTVQCSIGPVEGTPVIRVRAYCNVDGFSGWQEVDEDGSSALQGYDYSLAGVLLVALVIVAVVAAVVLRRGRSRKPS